MKSVALLLYLAISAFAHFPPDPSSSDKKTEQLPPMLDIPDGQRLARPSFHGQEPADTKPPLIGRPDAHDSSSSSEADSSLSQLDSHEDGQASIGQSDGHESELKQSYYYNDDDGDVDETRRVEEGTKGEELTDADYHYVKKFRIYDEYDDADEGLLHCVHLECELVCPEGFQTDKDGCPICACLEDPCKELKCSDGNVCHIRDCESLKLCTKLTAECIPSALKKSYDQAACAIPMCSEHCPNGYKLDLRGCMTCKCEDAGPEASVMCPEIECVDRCESGYQRDTEDCMTCACLDAPSVVNKPVCATPMCTMYCPDGYVNDANGCMTCKCIEAGKKPMTDFVCAMPNCARSCKVYKKNEMGCMTCECEPKLCGEKVCESDQICMERIIRFNGIQTCVPKPLCYLSRETGGLSLAKSLSNAYGLFTADCEPNGAFKPMQCTPKQSECWCVDDRGFEIDGTRTSVYIAAHKPICPRNITVALTIRMLLVATPNSPTTVDDSVSQLTRSLADHVSAWMIIDKQYITIAQVENKPDENGRQVYVADVYVRYDGESDLPSAVEHMKRRMHMDRCQVSHGNSVLTPEPRSLTVEHKYSLTAREQRPLVTNTDNGLYREKKGWWSSCLDRHYKIFIIAGIIIIAILFIVIPSAVILIICHRRVHTFSFERQRLESQVSTSSEKSLLNKKDDKASLDSAGTTDEKTALA